MDNFTNHNLFHLLHQKSRSIKKQLNTELNKHNLYTTQWTILFCLYKFGPMTQTDIWTYLNVEAPTITRTLEKMEKNNWIIRQQGVDKRERIIEWTEQAKDTFSVAMKEVAELEETLLATFTDTEKTQLYHLLHKIKS